MTDPVRLIETVRVRHEVAPLWDRHRSRIYRSAKALGIGLGPIPAPSGADRIVRIEAGSDGIRFEERPVEEPRPLSVFVSTIPHPGYPHKTDRRGAFDEARGEAEERGAGEAMLLTRSGWVAEGSYTTLLWWEGAGLAAPPLELGILPSVARDRIAAIGGGITQMRVAPGHLRDRALFLANAARGIMEVVSLQGESVPRDPRTAVLAGRFWP